jgi:hypothetical protein
MNTRLFTLFSATCLCVAAAFVAPGARAQNANSLLTSNGPGAGNAQYIIKSINVSTPNTPEFTTLANDTQTKRYTLGKWLEMEVEFAASARSPEIDFKFFVVIAGQMLTGEETLVDVPAGQSLFTVMFIAPRTLTTLLHGQPLTSNSVSNIAVQILRPGVNAPAAIKLLKDGPPFYNTFQQVPGFVLAKPNTPFANLWWDRYESVRPPGAR